MPFPWQAAVGAVVVQAKRLTKPNHASSSEKYKTHVASAFFQGRKSLPASPCLEMIDARVRVIFSPNSRLVPSNESRGASTKEPFVR